MEITSLASPSRLRSMLPPACSPRAVSAIARAGQAAFSQYHAILGSPLANTRHAPQSTEPTGLARKLTWVAPLRRHASRQRAKSGAQLAPVAGPAAAPEQKLACHLPAGTSTAPPAIARHGNFLGVCTCVTRTRHAIAEIIAHLKPAGKRKVAAWRSILALCIAAVLIGEAGVRAVQAGIPGVAWDVSGGVHRTAGSGGPARSIGMKLDVNMESGTPHTIVAVNLQDVQLQSGTGVCVSIQSAPVHSEYLSQFTASEHTSTCASPVQVQRAQLPAVATGPFSGVFSTGQMQQLTFVVEGLKPGAYKVSLVSMGPGWKRTTLSSTFHVPLRVLEHSAGRLVPALRVSVLE